MFSINDDIRFVRHIRAERNTPDRSRNALSGLQTYSNNNLFRPGLAKGVAECAPNAASSSHNDDCFADLLHFSGDVLRASLWQILIGCNASSFTLAAIARRLHSLDQCETSLPMD